MTAVPKDRDANAALIKIISIVMFIITSMLSFGGVLQGAAPKSLPWLAVYMLNYLCIVSVNCFIMASAHCLCEETFSLRKTVELIVQTFIYSVLIYFCLSYAGRSSSGPMLALLSFMPFSTGRFWLMSIYIAMYLFSPFLNFAVSKMSQAQHRACIAVMLFMFCAVPGVLVYADPYTAAGGRSLLWFAALYMIAAYFRKYDAGNSSGRGRLFAAYICCAAATVAARAFLPGLFNSIFGKNDYFMSVCGYNSILTFLSSFCLYAFLMRMNIGGEGSSVKNILIRLAAPALGVYLIADCPALRPLLYKEIFTPLSYIGSPAVLLYVIICACVIYIAGAAVDYVRMLLFYPFFGRRRP